MGALKKQQEMQRDALRMNQEAAQQSARIQSIALSQPKPTQADNFMTNKMKDLGKLRLGIASTINAPMVAQMKTHLGA